MKAAWHGFLMLVMVGSPALADTSFDVRLSPGPRLVGTRAQTSGSGEVHVSLRGKMLDLEGTYQGLLGPPTATHLAMGSLPGVRGPVIATLSARDGQITGHVVLGSRELSAFQRGGLYIEIDSAEAPDGDLWGWVMPPSN